MSGWIRAHRKLWENPLFRGDVARAGMWMWMLHKAAWKETRFDVQGHSVTIRRGQLCVSEREMAEACGVGRQVVRTFWKRLLAENMINSEMAHKVTHARSIITICKYEEYQAEEGTANPATNPALTQSQPTKEEGKKDKKEEGAYAPSSFDAFWAVYPNRKEKAGARRKFAAAVKSGTDPGRIIDGARRYAESEAVRRGFAKHPTTWLNNGCWDDEPDQPHSIPQQRTAADERFARLMDFARRRDERQAADQRMADGSGPVVPAAQLRVVNERGGGNDDDGGLAGCAGRPAADGDQAGDPRHEPLADAPPAYAWGSSGAR